MIRYYLIALFLMCTTLIHAQNQLQIEIINLRNNTGQVSLELLNKDNISVSGKTELIKDNKCIISFEDIKDGTYAIRYFHDENSNKELDMNFLGIPKEGIDRQTNRQIGQSAVIKKSEIT